MKYMTTGVATFFIWLFSLILPNYLPDSYPAPLWWSTIQAIIALLFIFSGIQTIRIEKKYFAGILFLVLTVISLFVLAIGNARISG